MQEVYIRVRERVRAAGFAREDGFIAAEWVVFGAAVLLGAIVVAALVVGHYTRSAEKMVP
jgi:hypothetical protein